MEIINPNSFVILENKKILSNGDDMSYWVLVCYDHKVKEQAETFLRATYPNFESRIPQANSWWRTWTMIAFSNPDIYLHFSMAHL